MFPTVQVQDDAIRFLAPDGEAVFLIDGLKFNGELKFASCRETEDGFQLELGIPEERTELRKVTIRFQLVFSDTENGRNVNPWNVMVRRRSPLSMGKAGKLEKPVFWERPTEKTASGTPKRHTVPDAEKTAFPDGDLRLHAAAPFLIRFPASGGGKRRPFARFGDGGRDLRRFLVPAPRFDLG